MSALLRWVITRDLIFHAGDPDSKCFVGRGVDVEGRAILLPGQSFADAAAEPMRYDFQLLDDDGEVYYEGRSNDVGEDATRAFAPLDWAEGDGCTTMHWRPVGETSWRVL